MFLTIDAANRCRFARELEAMFADRKQVFIDRLRWDLRVANGQFEIDQFDDAQAIYIVALGKTGEHLGSLRLLRTDQPHILGSLFPHLCIGDVPTGPTILEVTRLCISPSVSHRERRVLRNQLISVMVDHALASGITALTGVVTAQFLDQILAMGWNCEALGERLDHCGSTLGAFRVNIGLDTPSLLKATGIYTAGLLNSGPKLAHAVNLLESA